MLIYCQLSVLVKVSHAVVAAYVSMMFSVKADGMVLCCLQNMDWITKKMDQIRQGQYGAE